MRTSINVTLSIAVLISSFFLVSCSGSEQAASRETVPIRAPISGEDDNLVPEEPEKDEGFFLAIGLIASIDDFVTYLIYGETLSGGQREKCFVEEEAGALASHDINCQVDVHEGYLYNRGYSLKLNYLADMCPIVSLQTYWYYNFESGRGPSEIIIERGGTDDQPTITGCTVDGQLFDGEDCSAENLQKNGYPISFIGYEGEGELNVVCAFDHSAGETIDNQPNCCVGKYTLKETGNDDVVSIWGTSLERACIGGQPTNASSTSGERPFESEGGWLRTKEGVPTAVYIASTVSQVHSGEAQDLEIRLETPIHLVNNMAPHRLADPVDGDTRTHEEIRQRFIPTSVNMSHVTPESAHVSQIPAFMYSNRNFPRYRLPAPNPHYRFECLDEAQEVKHRLDLRVREWNTASEFEDYGASNAFTPVVQNPDILGFEIGADATCALESNSSVDNGEPGEIPSINTACNDQMDWGDFYEIFRDRPVSTPRRDPITGVVDESAAEVSITTIPYPQIYYRESD